MLQPLTTEADAILVEDLSVRWSRMSSAPRLLRAAAERLDDT